MLRQFVINPDDGNAILKSPNRYIVTTKHSIFLGKKFYDGNKKLQKQKRTSKTIMCCAV